MLTGHGTAQLPGGHPGKLDESLTAHQLHLVPHSHCRTAAVDLQHHADCKQERSLPAARRVTAATLSLRQHGAGDTRRKFTLSAA